MTEPNGLSLAEDVQLVLSLGNAQLRQGATEVAAAALVDLVLRGRIGSAPGGGLFGGRPKLTLLDATPTGVPSLDRALDAFVARGKPWGATASLRKLWKPVAEAVQRELTARGFVAPPARFPSLLDHLPVLDAQVQQAASRRLDSFWLHPENVTDPRDAAFVDLIRNAGEQFNRGSALEPVVSQDWYPAALKDTIHEVLEAERALTAGPATGWEG